MNDSPGAKKCSGLQQLQRKESMGFPPIWCWNHFGMGFLLGIEVPSLSYPTKPGPPCLIHRKWASRASSPDSHGCSLEWAKHNFYCTQKERIATMAKCQQKIATHPMLNGQVLACSIETLCDHPFKSDQTLAIAESLSKMPWAMTRQGIWDYLRYLPNVNVMSGRGPTCLGQSWSTSLMSY